MSIIDATAAAVAKTLLPSEPSQLVGRRRGTVITVNAVTPPTVDVALGTTTLPGVRFLDGYAPAAGDVVFVDFTGPDPLVLGRTAPRESAWADAGSVQGYTWQTLRGLDLYHPASTPHIDFHRATGPAGDANADYNMRFINDANGRLRLVVGELFVESNWGIFGTYARIGYNSEPGWTYARFSHANFIGFTDYALLQNNFGDTYVNAASGKQIYFRGGNSTAFNVDGSGSWFDKPVSVQSQKIWLKAWNDNNHLIQYSSFWDSAEYFGYQRFRYIRGAAGGVCTVELANDVWTSGAYLGNFGGSGAGMRTRGGGNTWSAHWDGTLRFYVDVTNVKNFVIDHPLDKKKHLIHACLEGPEAGVYYRGQSQLEGGWIEVRLPDYFEALCSEEGRSVQLTCIADDPADEWCPVLHATYPKNGRFFVGLGSGMNIEDQRFWWEVKAVRRDVPTLLVEPAKTDVEVMGTGPYTYYKEK